MYNNRKSQDISNTKQHEDKYSRYNYDKVKVHLNSCIVGENNNMKESR